jgi:ABC-type glycerol-3-phosphate transport system substrate-binding protein
MKRKKKGVWVLLSIIAIVNFAVVGLNLLDPMPEGGEYEDGILRVWVTWGDDREQIQPLFDRFTQEMGQPVKVESGVRLNQLEEALASDTPPDIVILSNNAPVASYYHQGWIEPLDDWIEGTDIDMADIYPAPLSQCRLNDDTYSCLPWGADAYALYWNKDLFAAAGLDPERPPSSMDELIEDAEQLTFRNEAGEFSQVGFVPDYPRSRIGLYAHMFGGSWFAKDSDKLMVDSQPMIDTLNWQLQLFNQMGTAEADQFVSSIYPYSNSKHAVFGGIRMNCQQCHRYAPPKNNMPENGFYDGKIAMLVDGEWQLDANYISTFKPGLNYGVAPFPASALHPELANSSIIQGPVAVISTGTQDNDAATRLLAWMMTPETVAELAYSTNLLPTSHTAAQDLHFEQIPNFQMFMDLVASPNSISIMSTQKSGEVNQALVEAERNILHETGGDPASVLSNIQTKFVSESQGSLITKKYPIRIQ